MKNDNTQLLMSHLRRTIRNFALYEAVSTGAITLGELARRLNVPAASLQVKLHRARDAAKKHLQDNDMLSFLNENAAQREPLE